MIKLVPHTSGIYYVLEEEDTSISDQELFRAVMKRVENNLELDTEYATRQFHGMNRAIFVPFKEY